MGCELCTPKKNKVQASTSVVLNENENPFDSLSKKERICIRETFQRLEDPKEIVGLIFLNIVNDIEPDLKKAFGVDKTARPLMMKMPKFGGHVARFTDLLDQMTSMLGFTHNLMGAWQYIRKTGRNHVQQGFLETNQNQLEKNYFEIVGNAFIEQFVPYVTGEQEMPNADGTEKKKVRFATNYQPAMIEDCWKRFFQLVIGQMTDSFEQERGKQLEKQNTNIIAPHQKAELDALRQKKIKEKQDEIENKAANSEGKEPEQMHEDPF